MNIDFTNNVRRAVYGTQGGGLVAFDEDCSAYVFVDAPPACMDLNVGDLMPAEWSLGGFVRYIN